VTAGRVRSAVTAGGGLLAVLDRLAEALTPAPISVPAFAGLFAEDFTGWRTLARSSGRERLDPWSRAHLGELAALESSWAEHAAGDTLLHTDIRADNLLLTSGVRRGPGSGPVFPGARLLLAYGVLRR